MIVDLSHANTPRWFISPFRDSNMRVPDEVLKSVVYVGLRKVVGRQENYKWGGTAWIVGVRSKIHSGRNHLYFVTAQHSVEKLKGKEFAFRVNTISGGARIIKCRKNDKWWYHYTIVGKADTIVETAVLAGCSSLRDEKWPEPNENAWFSPAMSHLLG